MGSVGNKETRVEKIQRLTNENFKTAKEWNEINSKKIDKTSFTNEGNGQWTMDIEGVGGGQLLDERDSSRAGFGSGPAYGITIWDSKYNSEGQQIFYGSLNEAKQEFKRRLKALVKMG